MPVGLSPKIKVMLEKVLLEQYEYAMMLAASAYWESEHFQKEFFQKDTFDKTSQMADEAMDMHTKLQEMIRNL